MLCFFVVPAVLSAQKYNFQNFNVQHGLIQSQVNGICQDGFDNLWIATLGGISRFDGKTFSNFTESEGLINNFTNCIKADHAGNIWIGTNSGLSKFNGSRFSNYRFSNYPNGNFVDAVEEDGRGQIWIKAQFKLYRIDSRQKVFKVEITGPYEILSAIAVDRQGVLWAGVFKKGIFRLDGKQWVKVIALNEAHQQDFFRRIIFDREKHNRLFLLCKNKLVSAEGGALMEKESLLPPVQNDFYQDIFQDESRQLWLLSRQGLFLCSAANLIPFNEENGYIHSNATAIFQDRERNIWFGTNGSGIFRYSHQPFLIFDEFSASRNAGVMSLIEENNHRLYIGTDGAGLFVYDDKKMIPLRLPSLNPQDSHILHLSGDNQNNIYILCATGRIWKFDQRRFREIKSERMLNCPSAVLPDSRGGIWIAGCSDCCYREASGKITTVLKGAFNKFLYLSDDSILTSSLNGLYLLRSDLSFRKIDDSLIDSSSLMAMSHLGKYYLLATANKGLILYNTQSHHSQQLTRRDGLNSDFVYSVTSDQDSLIWLGTGRGVNKLILDTASGKIRVFSWARSGEISSAESNQDAVVYDDKHNLWVGTGAGLMKYFPEMPNQEKYIPPVILQGVKLFSKEIPPGKFTKRVSPWYGIPENLSLPNDENHLSFSFGSSSFLNTNRMLYQYQLMGMEKIYSQLTPNREVVFPGLPPGQYTFKARAYLPGSGYSKNTISFPFVISEAFYQTLFFKVVFVVLLLGLVLWIQWLRIKQQNRRQKEMEEIKKAENIKVRQIASEDFHDEIGNTLTRIQVLTDVLQTKIGTTHEEENRIIRQIKENLGNMYQGTRDILWTLNAESDQISEIADRLVSMGVEIFQDTPIKFVFENKIIRDQDVLLPGNYSRNILMILKEAMYNSLKYSKASTMLLIVERIESRVFIILNDDGIGYDTVHVNKGHGTDNMFKRASRIRAEFVIESHLLLGTTYQLIIPLR